MPNPSPLVLTILLFNDLAVLHSKKAENVTLDLFSPCAGMIWHVNRESEMPTELKGEEESVTSHAFDVYACAERCM